MTTPTLKISLELDVGEDSLTGRASDGNAGPREFSGWLGLLAAIDALIEENTESAPP